jgi:hypothetical protein
MSFEFKQVYSKKYLTVILGILVGIAALVFGASQIFVGCVDEKEYGEPYVKGPTSPPNIPPPTSLPPQ